MPPKEMPMKKFKWKTETQNRNWTFEIQTGEWKEVAYNLVEYELPRSNMKLRHHQQQQQRQHQLRIKEEENE